MLWCPATLTRQSVAGPAVQCPARIYYQLDSYTPSPRAARDDQGAGSRFTFAFRGAELDGEPADAPGPLTDAELISLHAWWSQDRDAQQNAAEQQRELAAVQAQHAARRTLLENAGGVCVVAAMLLAFLA